MVILAVCMAFSGLLFLLLTALYIVQRFAAEVSPDELYIPRAFMGSTMLILVSSLFLMKSRHVFLYDEARSSLRWLAAAIVCGLGFTALQVTGWGELHARGFHFPELHVADSFVYVISGIHLMHAVVSLGLLCYIFINFYKKSGDPVSRLLLETNPCQIQKQKVAYRLWHFVAVIWIFLFSVFLLTF